MNSKQENDYNSIVKKSKKGIDYVLPCELNRGKRTYSQAILMKINHSNETKTDISLKLGRYNIVNRQPVSDEPKSELTLKNSELEALIQYISENYKPLTMGAGEYINVDSDDVEIINRFQELLNQSEEAAELIVKHKILTDNTYSAVSFLKKKESIEEFENRLSENLAESFWQEWFENNKWILGSDFAKIVDERRLDVENIADYIMQAYDGFVDIVEIKKPNNMQFWASKKDHDNYVPSSDLVRAITQCLNYIKVTEQKSDSVSFTKRVGCKVIKPRCILVFGRSNNWDNEQMEAFRILNAAYNQISILTYDHLLERAKNMLGINESEDEELPF